MIRKIKQSRRSILKAGLAAPIAVGMLADVLKSEAIAGPSLLTAGDANILRFLAALEIIETDLWGQYNEIYGIQDNEDGIPFLGGTGNPLYTSALTILDTDMKQYVHDNTEDEFTHQNFLNAYLKAKGVEPVDLEPFRRLQGSTAPGSSGMKRLTNLMQLTVDTSWWTRYRSRNQNPDIGNPMFLPVIPGLLNGQFPAIPRSPADMTGDPNNPDDHVKAIAFTAGFHFATIEQGGSSLYPSLAQRVTSAEVLRILLSIGPTETSHFQTWHDKAGNFTQVTDPITHLAFPDPASLTGEDFQPNLIMPEPTEFLSPFLPVCSIIRPTETQNAATNAFNGLKKDGLFVNQKDDFFDFMENLAALADMAQRGF